MPAPVQLAINGEAREVPAGLTVAALVAHLGLTAERVAIEKNERVIRRAEWAAEPVADGDRIEIVNFVGGG